MSIWQPLRPTCSARLKVKHHGELASTDTIRQAISSQYHERFSRIAIGAGVDTWRHVWTGGIISSS
jgi:hypothetical protein